MKASGIKHDGRAAKTGPAAAVDVLDAAAGARGVRETEMPVPLLGDTVLDPGVDEVILSAKRS